MEFEKLILEAVRTGVQEGVQNKLNSTYSNPLSSMLDDVIKSNRYHFVNLLDDAIKSCVNDEVFREEVKAGSRKALAKVLVQRFGGELEKQVNALKSDPVTRARIISAIDEIVKSQSEKTA